MKFISLAAVAFSCALSTLAQDSVRLTYDNTYDDASLPLSEVACSNGVNGLLTKGYTTLGSLPTFPNLCGAYTVTGYDSPYCGTCYQITYEGMSIYALAVDYAAEGFNLSEEAMNKITDGKAYDLGSVGGTAVQVEASYCGL